MNSPAIPERRVAGKRLSRLDGVGKVTGSHVYAADFVLPGMLFGKVLRSPHAHARIVRLDVARARALPGVRCVMTAADLPAIRFGTAVKDRPVLAHGEVRFAGRDGAARVLQRLGSQRRPVDVGAPQRVLAHQRERGVQIAYGSG